ncbi:MAG TPA: YciI family protein [Stellaceae bacterium]|jgi:hypothetical protein|nr:YciI family protein [Stellaceae bacterium]
MRFMLQVRADRDSEAGVLPDKDMFAAMVRFNEEMVNAGVMLAADGLHPSSNGARVSFAGAKRTVTEGPFPDPSELIAGFWIIKVESKQQAIDWAKRVPFLGGMIEIRQIFEAEDFGPALTPELREAEDRMRAQLGAKN